MSKYHKTKVRCLSFFASSSILSGIGEAFHGRRFVRGRSLRQNLAVPPMDRRGPKVRSSKRFKESQSVIAPLGGKTCPRAVLVLNTTSIVLKHPSATSHLKKILQ